MNSFLPLTDYSTKYKVSLSTLRRRIKCEEIQYVFEGGKYLILDEPMGTHQRDQRPSQVNSSDDTLMGAPSTPSILKEMAPAFSVGLTETALARPGEEPILTAANRLLTELKKAYTQILHEKEEHILHLREEVADLKTLVRVLESENQRLQERRR